MDIFFGGSGISFKVDMETADKSGDNAHFFKVKTVNIDIQNMDIKVKQSNHKLLFSLFKPLLIKVVRPVVQKVLEKQIRDNVLKLDGMCFRAKKEADRAAEQARRSPDPEGEVKSMYQYYFTAFQNQISQAQQKKDEAASDKQTNVAITQHESIFKHISLPGGFSTQATKYKDMARQGEKWQSPIFGIGSASESRDIQPTRVTRRSPFGNADTQDRYASSRSEVGSNQGWSKPLEQNRVGALDMNTPTCQIEASALVFKAPTVPGPSVISKVRVDTPLWAKTIRCFQALPCKRVDFDSLSIAAMVL